MLKDLIIVGSGGFGREVAWLAERINRQNATWNLLGFLDDNTEKLNANIGGYPVLGKIDTAHIYPDAYFVCAIGSSKIRRTVINSMGGVKFATLIDPSVLLSDRVSIGAGTIICAGTIITVDISIGNHVIINLDCTVGHDAVLGDYVTINPGVNISGMVNIGESSEVGTGTQIIQGKKIGCESIIGAGAVIVRDIPEKCTAVGIPAKPVKFF